MENPYGQYFCGAEYFSRELPIDPSLMTKWRNRLKSGGLEKLLAETIKAGLRTRVLKPSSLQRVNVDTTVQEKAVTFPTDAKLYYRLLMKRVRTAKAEGLELRQSDTRSAIEPVIGHMKNDGRLGRNNLLGMEGDKINAILCGAGHNIRKLPAWLLFFLFGRGCKIVFQPAN